LALKLQAERTPNSRRHADAIAPVRLIHVEKAGELLFSLYFDGGGERKLQIKSLKKGLCKVHATWQFDPPLQNQDRALV
jgi:hypothetical protein